MSDFLFEQMVKILSRKELEKIRMQPDQKTAENTLIELFEIKGYIPVKRTDGIIDRFEKTKGN